MLYSKMTIRYLNSRKNYHSWSGFQSCNFRLAMGYS